MDTAIKGVTTQFDNEGNEYVACCYMNKGKTVRATFSVHKYGLNTAIKYATKLNGIIRGTRRGFRHLTFNERRVAFLQAKYAIMKKHELSKLTP